MSSAVLHYILCTRYVFSTKTNSYTGSVYLLTCMRGNFFLNSILRILYDVLHISFQYSKVISVGESFFKIMQFVMYYLRMLKNG